MSEERTRALRNGASAAGIMLALVLFHELHRVTTLGTAIAPISYAVVAFSSVYHWSLPARLEERLSLNSRRDVPAMVRGAVVALSLAVAFGYFAGDFHRYVEWSQVFYLTWAAGMGALIGNFAVNIQTADAA